MLLFLTIETGIKIVKKNGKVFFFESVYEKGSQKKKGSLKAFSRETILFIFRLDSLGFPR